MKNRAHDQREATFMIRLSHAAPLPRSVADEHAAMRARAQLQNSSYPELRGLDCSFAEGVLTVHGRLPSFYLKQVVWSLVAQLAEIEEVADGIEIIDPPPAR
jgi:hypothetical protein